MNFIENETWKPVKGKEDWAEIRSDGFIHYFPGKSCRYPNDRWTWGTESGDYLNATFGNETKGVHQWVYLTFIGEIPEGMQVNHINENKHDNRVENLNLMTSKQNNNWGTANARRAATLTNGKTSKSVEALNPVTMTVAFTFPSTNEAGRQGFNQGSISQCCNGKRKFHKGLLWRYKA